MIQFDQLVNLWEDFFFNPTQVYTIALFRILLGIILLFDACYILFNIGDYLGPNGLVNADRYEDRSKNKVMSVFLYLPKTMLSVYLIIGFHIVFVMLTIVGLFTPVSTALTYITLRSIINRNAAICNGGDNVAKIMCFYLIFTPAGHAYSLDDYFFYSSHLSPNENYMQAPWAIRLMQIQVSIIYINTAYWKLKGITYRNGTAIYYVMKNANYRRFSLPEKFTQRPFVYILTWVTLAGEYILGVGLWVKELCYPNIVWGYILHLSIEYLVNVHLFSYYMMAVLLLFVDPMDIKNFIETF